MQNRDTQQKTADSSGSRRKAEPSTLALYLDASAVRGANPAGNRQPQTAAGSARDRASSARQQRSKQVWRIFERDPDAVRRPRPPAKMPRRSASTGRLAEWVIHQGQQCPAAVLSIGAKPWVARRTADGKFDTATPCRLRSLLGCGRVTHNLQLIGRLARQLLREPASVEAVHHR